LVSPIPDYLNLKLFVQVSIAYLSNQRGEHNLALETSFENKIEREMLCDYITMFVTDKTSVMIDPLENAFDSVYQSQTKWRLF
jgi:hypothetical protein